MNDPEDMSDIEKDYLDVSDEFETNDDALDKDFDEDSDEGIFTLEKPVKKKSGLVLAGAAVLLALLCGGGFYYYSSVNSDFKPPRPIPTPSVPHAQNEKAGIPGLPQPASDFAPNTPAVNNGPPAGAQPAGTPPVVSANTQPVTLNQNMPGASLPKLPGTTENADSISEVGTNSAAAPHISDKHAPSEPDATLSQTQPAPKSEATASVVVEQKIPQTPTELAKAQNIPTPDNSVLAPVTSAEKTPVVSTPKVEANTEKAIPAKQETKKSSTPDNFYFDAPKGKALTDIPPPSINLMKEPGQSIIIVHKPGGQSTSRDDSVIVEKSEDSADIDKHLVKAGRAANLGMNDEALGFYNDLYKKNSHDPRILMGRAVALQKAGENQKAIDAYREVLETEPDNAEAITNLMGLIGKTQPAVALQNLIDLHEKYPKNTAVSAQLGVAYAQSGNSEDGLRCLKMAADQDPKNPLHYYNMAVIYDHQNNRAQAIENYEKSLDAYSIYAVDTDNTFSKEQVYDRLAALRGN